VLVRALETGVNTARTSSAGRLFEAVASLLGVCHRSEYEGHAASLLEFAARRASPGASPYPLEIAAPGTPGGALVVDWRPAIHALLAARRGGESAETSAARFHATLVDAIVRVASIVGVETVALTGGCFQNPTLLAQSLAALERRGHRVIRHRQIPPNDGGLAVGQLVAASRGGKERWNRVSRDSGSH
jgi:hydrogenase maturation protein HypF